MKKKLYFPFEVPDVRERQEDDSFLKEELKENGKTEVKLNSKLVKEDVCEECGAFDLLTRYENKFICGNCLAWIRAIRANKKVLKITRA